MSGSEDIPLAESPSPYLRNAARQPVKWVGWGAAAFQRARSEDKPVLLGIGAIWCHWCHVMDRESYQDPDIASLINARFIPLRVDRDQRPDVDIRYQRALQLLTGQGGWPLTGFLTPEGELFFGGTYFPPEDRRGQPGFPSVLSHVLRLWEGERSVVYSGVDKLRERLEEVSAAEVQAGQLKPDMIERVLRGYAGSYDSRYGGFGRSPKFPPPAAVMLHLDRWLDTGDARLRGVATATLDGMVRGGLHDHLGGGFHRYTTDARWLIPHFEKMAYDNGTLLEAYSCAYSATGKDLYRVAGEGIVRYYLDVAPDLVEEGGFPASQDADAAGDDDGGYWTWTTDEVLEALDGDERLFRAAMLHFGLDEPASRLPSNLLRRVLFRAMESDGVARHLGVSLGEARRLLEQVRQHLRRARGQRPMPFVDRTLYSGWVSLVAGGHLAAARHLGLEDAAASGLRALDRLWKDAYVPGAGMAHRAGSGSGGVGDRADADGAAGDVGEHSQPEAGQQYLLDDQAYTAQALLAAYELTQRQVYLDRATALAEVLLTRFLDPEVGVFSDRPGGEPAVVDILAKPLHTALDMPEPAGNAVAAMVLLKMAELNHSSRYREVATGVLGSFAGGVARLGTGGASYSRAVDWATSPVTHVSVIAPAGEPDGEALLRSALWVYRPRMVVRRYEPGTEKDYLPAEVVSALDGKAPRAYVCVGSTCAAPVTAPEELERLLRKLPA